MDEKADMGQLEDPRYVVFLSSLCSTFDALEPGSREMGGRRDCVRPSQRVLSKQLWEAAGFNAFKFGDLTVLVSPRSWGCYFVCCA